MINFFRTTIEFCNQNNGFFSLLISVIAVIISIRAIKNQNKGYAYEKRLAIYYETKAIYNKCKEIIELDTDILKASDRKKIISMVIFGVYSDEHEIICEATNNKAPSEGKITAIDYGATYKLDYINKEKQNDLDVLLESVNLFFNFNYLKFMENLIVQYKEIVSKILLFDEEHINTWKKETLAILTEIDSKNVFKKLQEHLPK